MDYNTGGIFKNILEVMDKDPLTENKLILYFLTHAEEYLVNEGILKVKPSSYNQYS